MSNGNPHVGATFAERKAIRLAAEQAETPVEKAVHPDAVEDKAVTSATSKARKAPAKKKA